jgi:hypothetical protein
VAGEILTRGVERGRDPRDSARDELARVRPHVPYRQIGLASGDVQPGAAGEEEDPDVRVPLVESPERRKHEDLCQRIRGRDLEQSGERAIGPERPAFQRERSLFHALGRLAQPLGGLGEHVAVADVLEQGDPEIPLEGADAPSDRRVVDPEHPPGGRQRARPGHCEEGPDVLPVRHGMRFCMVGVQRSSAIKRDGRASMAAWKPGLRAGRWWRRASAWAWRCST